MTSRYGRILIPLDGSHLAEAVVPTAFGLVEALGAELLLLHVVERRPPRTVHGEPHLTDETGAQRYLERIARDCTAVGCEVRIHVHSAPTGHVASEIAAHAAELGADLIVMATHGSGGLRDFLVGSIAQQTVQHGDTDLLLIRPQGSGEAPPFRCGEVVVCVEPSRHGAGGVAAGRFLADVCRAPVRLLTVVPTVAAAPPQRRAAAALSPRTAAAVLDLEEADAAQYLEDMADALRRDAVTVRCEVRRGDPLEEVARAVERRHDAVLVVATHGRAGIGGRISRSFAAGLVNRTPLPVLLTRVDPV